MIDWLYACHKAGVLTEAGTGLPLASKSVRAISWKSSCT